MHALWEHFPGDLYALQARHQGIANMLKYMTRLDLQLHAEVLEDPPAYACITLGLMCFHQ